MNKRIRITIDKSLQEALDKLEEEVKDKLKKIGLQDQKISENTLTKIAAQKLINKNKEINFYPIFKRRGYLNLFEKK